MGGGRTRRSSLALQLQLAPVILEMCTIPVGATGKVTRGQSTLFVSILALYIGSFSSHPFSFPYLCNTSVKQTLTVECHLVSYTSMESFKVCYQ